MNPEQFKPNNRYIYYRIYCILAVLIWNVVLFPDFFLHHSKLNFIYFFIMLPFMFPATIMVCNLAIFPVKYGIFGPNIRTPFPHEPSIFEVNNAFGSIGWCNFKGVTFKMHIFTSGLGISFLGGAKVFIPKSNILSVERNFFAYKLIHNSPELRNPVGFSSKENFEKIQEMLQGRG